MTNNGSTKPPMRGFLCPFPAEQYAELQALSFERTQAAQANGEAKVPMTAIVREAVTEYLDRHKRKATARA